MASENSNSENPVEDTSHEPRECMACRGTGRVVSNLGGAASSVSCPWCEGKGVRVPDIDAQARWLGEDAERDTEGDSSDPVA